MIGILSGAVAAMLFVSYLIQMGKFGGKKSKSKHVEKAAPNRNSPSASSGRATGVDESGCDEEKFV